MKKKASNPMPMMPGMSSGITIPVKLTPQMAMMAMMSGNEKLKKRIMRKMVDNMGRQMARSMFGGMVK